MTFIMPRPLTPMEDFLQDKLIRRLHYVIHLLEKTLQVIVQVANATIAIHILALHIALRCKKLAPLLYPRTTNFSASSVALNLPMVSSTC